MMYRYWRKLFGDRTGSVAVEFALIVPVLIFVLQGIVVAAIALNKYVMLTDAVRVGVRELAMSRGVGTTPKTNVLSKIYASAPTLTQANFVVTIKIDGTACSTDAGCVTALNAAQGKPAQVIATYPCNLKVLNYDFFVACTLTSQTTEYVQ